MTTLRPFPTDTPSREPRWRKAVVRWRRGQIYGLDFGAPNGVTEVGWAPTVGSQAGPCPNVAQVYAAMCGYSTTSIRYAGPFGNGSAETSEGFAAQPIGAPCRVDRLLIDLDVAPGAGKSWTVTLRKNGVNTDLSVVIADTATQAQDTTHAVTFLPGDYATLGVQPSGTPTDPVLMRTGCRLINLLPHTSQAFFFSFGLGWGNGDYGAAITLDGTMQPENSELDPRIQASLAAVAGYVTGIWVRQSGTPTGTPRYWQLRKNGADVPGVVVSLDAQWGSLQGLAVPFAVGDMLSYFHTRPAGSSHTIGYCTVYESELGYSLGNAVAMAIGNTNPTYFRWAQHGSFVAVGSTTQADNEVVLPADVNINGLTVIMDAVILSGRSWTWELLADGVGTGVSVTLSEGEQEKSTNATYAASAGERLVMRATPSGSPSSGTETFFYFGGAG